jgi:hypothetical protein
MNGPLKIRVSPQDIGYPEITVPESLRAHLEAAERVNGPEGWDALHMACVCHSYPRPAFTPAWEADYAALAWLTKYAVAMHRAALLRRILALKVPPSF